MKKLELIALFVSALVEISTPVSLYTLISDAEHVAHDNRLPKKLQPVELMVDNSNHMGFRVLHLHSNLNKNNIGLSPCGLMSVLVALYEGSAGRSTIELREALSFPSERDIVRVGIRDIHRRLRSYFYKKENLLSGLIFNKENITIRPEYETVLRFYGYDLDGASNMLTESKMNETGGNMTSVTEATDSAMSTPGNETVTDDDEKQADEVTTLQSTEQTSDDDAATTTDEVNGTEDNTEDNATPGEGEDEDVTTVAPPSRKRRARLGGHRAKNRRDKKQSLVIKSPFEGVTKRRSRSYYVLLDEDYENDFHLDSTPPASVAPPLGPTSTANPIPSPRPSLSKYRHNSHPKDLFDNPNSDTVEHIFYINDHESVRVPFKIYDSVMKYAHVGSLQASFLEIDLDTEYYNLILIVPDHLDGLSDLTNKLRLHESSTLRRIRNAMEFFWVKTIVPKFSLKGNTILTNDLQNMGMNDIFEPTKADFSQLADDKTLYVKNVEQMININIRTQTTQQLKKISSLYKHPIEVPVNIPFVYCVVDKELDLVIIAGRIVNPLNSRIQ